MLYRWILLIAMPCIAQCSTLEKIPIKYLNEITNNGTVPVIYACSNNFSSDQFYSAETVQHYIDLAKKKRTLDSERRDAHLYQALEKYASCIADKDIAILGSKVPWCEGLVLAYGAHPMIIEWNQTTTNDSLLKGITPQEYEREPVTYDAIFCMVPFESEGIGRDGISLMPNGDLAMMEKAKKRLKKEGMLFLSVPVGRDCIVWNLRRVYGNQRLNSLLKGWRIVESFGFDVDDFDKSAAAFPHQPVFVLKPMESKPVVDFRDLSMGRKHALFYERPHLVYSMYGKNSDVLILSDYLLSQVDEFRKQGYKKIVAYLMEPPAVHPWKRELIEANLDKFDLILTFDKYLLDRYPEKCKFVHASGWGTLSDHKIHKKTKMCSFMDGLHYNENLEGHRFRKEILKNYRGYLDGIKTIDMPKSRWKDTWTNDFHFAIIIENSREPHYFSEKITECLRAGTVPIYRGCPTIANFFDMDGIIVFNSIEELGEILKNLSAEEYQKRMPSIVRNFELAAKYPQNNLIDRNDYPSDSMDVIWKYIEPYFYESP